MGEGREVAVFAHSYGGSVVTEGLAGLGVKRLVLLSATVLRVSETQITAMRMEAGGFLEDIVSCSFFPRVSPYRSIGAAPGRTYKNSGTPSTIKN